MTQWLEMARFILRRWEERERFFPNVFSAREIVAYEDLGTEAIRKLEVKNFPVIVVIDSQGNNWYETASKEYAE